MAVEDAWYSLDRKTGEKVPTKRHGRGKRWRVRNRGARTESFTRKTDADRRDVALRSDLDRGGYVDPKAGRESFTSYAERHVRDRGYGHGSMSAVNARLTHLTAYFGDRQLREVTPSSVKAFKASLAERRTRAGEPLSSATQNLVFGLLVSVMRAAVTDQVIARDPTAGIPRPTARSRKVTRVWEQGTVSAILAAVPDRHHAAVALAAQCGLRHDETLAVSVGDVDFLRKQVTVRHQVDQRGGTLTLVPPKRGKVRTVPLPKVTRDALSAHIERYGTASVRCECCKGQTHAVLFVDRGRLWDHRDWNRLVWHPALRGLGVEPSRSTGVHQLRHYYASVLIENGASVKQVASYLGHESIRTTLDIYADLFERSHDRARDIIDAAFNASDAGAYPLRTARDQ